MATFPLATLAAIVSPIGITTPSYDDILTSLKTSWQQIYGSDVYLGSDTQDGQALAIFAQAIYDSNQTCIAVYNQFSPSTAQGAGLSSLVKQNGIRRLIPTYSQVDLLLGGSVGTVINKGVAADAAGNQWVLPSSVTIPIGGSILITAHAQQPGSIAAGIGAVNVIATPTFGWSTVNNSTAATPGLPVETDAALRQRQALSTRLIALTVLEATVAAIAGIAGVISVTPYENSTGSTDANGLPAHSISMVVLGGDATAIATAIANKKTPGCATYGTTTINVTDKVGITHPINFYIPTQKRIVVAITIKALAGYVSSTGVAVKQALADYINAIGVGHNVMLSRLYLPAQLNGTDPRLVQYEVTVLNIAIFPSSPSTADLTIAFNEVATSLTTDITLTVV